MSLIHIAIQYVVTIIHQFVLHRIDNFKAIRTGAFYEDLTRQTDDDLIFI